MKATTTLLAALALLLATSQVAVAQQARAAVGVRAGSLSGVSAKAFVTENIAFELNAGFGKSAEYTEKNINGGLFFYLTDHGFTSPMWRNISLYGGLGLGRSYFTYDQDWLAGIKTQTGTGEEGELITRKATYDDMSLNFKAYIGAQYLLPNLPLEITADLGPNILPGRTVRAIGGHASLGVRYILLRQQGQVR